MSKSFSKEQLEHCMLSRLSGEETVHNPFEDMSDEVALMSAAYLAESAAFYLASKASTEDTAELIRIASQLSRIAVALSHQKPSQPRTH